MQYNSHRLLGALRGLFVFYEALRCVGKIVSQKPLLRRQSLSPSGCRLSELQGQALRVMFLAVGSFAWEQEEGGTALLLFG